MPHYYFNLTPLLFKKLSLIQKLFKNLKKAFHHFVELVKTNLLLCNTMHFDQYSLLAILLNIFLFSANNSKTNLKKKTFHNRARRDESIDVYNTLIKSISG